uniref:hypothetical protein n=1 Tax=Ochrobactrum sp. LM19 TaxID=1449781 RepID=UPI0015E82ACD|nr:hypothetical protein [Ochrobactrum sp. LM19]
MSTNDDFTKKYAAKKQIWRKQSLLPGYVESKTYLTHDVHAKLTNLASQTGMRMPFLLGLLIEEHLEYRQTGNVETPRIQLMDDQEQMPPDIFKLMEMIYSSRFPEDTGSTRFRHTSLITAILTETSSGSRPTVRNIAHRSNTHDSQLNLLVKALVERGVITRTLTPGAVPSRSAKILAIHPDAIQNLEKAHLKAVGTSLLAQRSE